MATENIRIVVSEDGSRVVTRNISDIGTSSQKSATAVDVLKRSLQGLGVAFGVTELVRIADTYTNLQNKLRLVTDGTDQLSVVTKKLLDISNETRTSFESTVTLFARSSSSLKNLGYSTQQTLDFTRQLSQAVLLSGATSEEATQGIIQLSQGMSLGVLRGQDLKSVLEQLPAVADVIAKGLGVTRGELQKLAEQGKITTKAIIDAFSKQSQELDQKTTKSIMTVAQAFVILKNNALDMIGRFSTATNTSVTLADAVKTLGQNLDIVAGILASLAGISLAQVITGFVSARTAMLSAAFAAAEETIALNSATTAAAENARMVAAMATAHRAAAGAIAETTIVVGSSGVAVVAATTLMTTLTAGVLTLGRGLLTLVGGPIGILINGIIALTFYLGGLQDTLLYLGAGFKKFGNEVYAVWEGITGGVQAAAERMYDILFSLGQGLANFVAHPFAEGNFTDFGVMLEQGFTGAFKGAFSSALKEADQFNAEIDKKLFASIDKLHNVNQPRVDLTVKGVDHSKPVEDPEWLKLQKKLLDDVLGPQRKYAEGQQILNLALKQGKITAAQFDEEMAKIETKFLNSKQKTGFADGYVSQLRLMQLETRNAAADMGAELAKVFGPGGTLVQGIGDAVAQSIVFGKSFKQSIAEVSQEILSKLISSLVQIGVNMLINYALGETLKASSTTTSVAAAGVTAAAWTPAAAMTSLASFGSNSIGAIAGIGASIAAAAAAAASVVGFESGGYTGNGGTSQIAGVVHGQEFVVNAGATARNRGMLEAMNAGGTLSAGQSSSSNGGVTVNIINQAPGVDFQTNQIGPNEVEIIARRIVREDAPKVISADIGNPNSRTSKALAQNTDTSRRR